MHILSSSTLVFYLALLLLLLGKLVHVRAQHLDAFDVVATVNLFINRVRAIIAATTRGLV